MRLQRPHPDLSQPELSESSSLHASGMSTASVLDLLVAESVSNDDTSRRRVDHPLRDSESVGKRASAEIGHLSESAQEAELSTARVRMNLRRAVVDGFQASSALLLGALAGAGPGLGSSVSSRAASRRSSLPVVHPGRGGAAGAEGVAGAAAVARSRRSSIEFAGGATPTRVVLQVSKAGAAAAAAAADDSGTSVADLRAYTDQRFASFWLPARIRGTYEPLACLLVCAWLGWGDSVNHLMEAALFGSLLGCSFVWTGSCLLWGLWRPESRRGIPTLFPWPVHQIFEIAPPVLHAFSEPSSF